MRIVIYILMVLCVLLVILCYSLCVMASEADERADRMYRKWKESKGADDERDYERAAEQREYDMLYESTYNPEDGSM